MLSLSSLLTIAFVGFLILTVGLKYWLAARQIRHVMAHAGAVPAQFSERISLDAHRKAAAYTIARTKLGIVETAVGAGLILALTLLGGLNWLNQSLAAAFGAGFWQQITLVVAVLLLLTIMTCRSPGTASFILSRRSGSTG